MLLLNFTNFVLYFVFYISIKFNLKLSIIFDWSMKEAISFGLPTFIAVEKIPWGVQQVQDS
jgi:hypothetical protein